MANMPVSEGSCIALHSVDKDSLDRGSPTPNHSDVLIDGATKAHKTISTHYATDADTTPGRLQQQNKQILANDGTTNRGLYGYNAALATWGFFLTKFGVEVTTNTDLSQFIFNSSQDIFKIVKKVPIALTFTPPDTGFHQYSQSVAHGLTFTPSFEAMLSTPNLGTVSAAGQTGNPHLLYDNVASSIKLFGIYFITVDSTNVTFHFDASNISGGPYTAMATVYLQQETFS